MDSIRQKGVLEPILVRPIPDGPRLVSEKSWPNHQRMVDFEIVAGERRFRASFQIAGENGGPESSTIPAIVKPLSDDETFDVMTVENIQREDLTELEEASNFKQYLDRKGDGAVEELAARTGIHPAYIRRRVRVLGLPKKVLALWDAGKLKYGHLEQLCRVKAQELGEWVKAIEGDTWSGQWSVRELKERIDNASPALSCAFFDLEKEGCLGCGYNSEVQKKLFADDQAKEAICSNPKCFKQKQNNWLSANWQKSALRKKYKTNGFCFYNNFDHRASDIIFSARDVLKPYKKCEKLVTVIRSNGSALYDRACLDTACHAKTKKAQAAEKRKTQDKAADTAGAGDGRGADDAGWFFLDRAAALEKIRAMDINAVREDLGDATVELVLDKTVTTAQRRTIGDLLGIDLYSEWRIDAEYLAKKTTGEMLALGEKLGIFADPTAEAFLKETLGRRGFKACKKGELARVFLERRYTRSFGGTRRVLGSHDGQGVL